MASPHIHQAAETLGATAWVRLVVAVVCQALGLNGVKQRTKSRKAGVRNAGHGKTEAGGADSRAACCWGTKAGSLLGCGKDPLSESTKAVWARQDRANRQRKQQMESGLLFSLPMVISFSSLLPVPPSQNSHLRRTLSLRLFFSLECGLERVSQACGVNGGSALTLCLGY